ncbi:Brp/Blh family beta-carotene 15,15'-dioxygenase [Winogradskyella sp. PG-2]|uniref:Brp/Blh family beta-carotene 15,15'-dioxygenase n=1 Tax=Winogradskyella sp. PG-2 TaxID=754409 RepID=UPI0004588F62|nr:Brp/Blh family beta-carotene 15,15'-dioxygenase [Winogradskyella sp. PG-2]BAO77630.1 predictet Brp-like protein Blh [Winogradskyella sp. PG-2]
MRNIYNILIPLSFVGLWITSMVSKEVEVLFGFILIFTFGILHGSNDILLIDTVSNEKKTHPFIRVLITYLLTVFIAVAVFYFFPLIALVLFVVFSAFHFGQQHWEYKELEISMTVKNIYYFLYGMVVLELLFVYNTTEVIEVVSSITNYELGSKTINWSLIVFGIMLFLIALFIANKSKTFKSYILIELFYLIVFAIIFNVSSLIWGFTIYFILWHSIPSLYEQVSFIYGNFNKRNLLRYCKTAFPYWLISIIGMLIVYFIFKDEKLFYAIFFSFIAAVTFPHTLVINKLFSNKKTQSN